MARVTVEDCVEKIPNRFELVMVAAQRSRDVAAGSQLTVDRDNDKNPVVALREIAEAKIDIDEVRGTMVRNLQKHVEIDEPEEEEPMDLMAAALSGEVFGIAQRAAEAEFEDDIKDEESSPAVDDDAEME